MADKNLTATIEIKTNSPLAKKQLETVEKELMKLNILLKATDKSGVKLSKSLDKVGTAKLARGVDFLNQSLIGLKKALPDRAVRSMSKELASLNSTVSSTVKLLPIVKALGIAFNVLTNEQLLRRISRLAKIASFIATIKGYRGLAKALRAIGRGFAFAAIQAEKFNNAKDKIQLLLFKSQVDDTSISMHDLGQAIQSIESAVNILRSLLDALDSLTDPARIKRLSLIANILGNIAVLKGFDSQGEALKGVADRIDDFAMKVQEAKEATKTFDEKLISVDNTLERVVVTIDIAKKSTLGLGSALVLVAGVKFALSLNREINLVSAALAGNLGDSLRKSTSSFEAFKASINKTGISFKNIMSKAIRPAIPGIIGFTDEMTKVGLVLTLVGSKVEQSENQLVSFAGTMTKIVGIAIGGLSIIASLAITALGALIQTISIKLFNTLDELSIKFEMVQAKLKQFTFIVEGFGKAFGTKVAGTLKQWNSLLRDVTRNSTTAGEEVRKSISSLVKEAQILGFTARDIEKVVRRANDVAAATGQKLGDVTQSLIAGFVGQSQAALNLGVDLREATVAHGQLEQGVENLAKVQGSAAKVQLRLNEFFKQTIPIIGAAKLTIDSLTGSQQKLSQEVVLLSSRIGGSASLLIAYNQILTKLVRTVNLLPPALFELLGMLLQVSAVAGIVIGTFLKYAAIVATLSTVFVILNAVILNSVTVQQVLTTSLGIVAAQAGVTTGAITTLSGALAAMGAIIKAQLILTVKSLGVAIVSMAVAVKTALIAGAKAVAAFIIPLLPLIIKIGLVIGVVILFGKAIKSAAKDLGPLTRALIDAFRPLSSLDKSLRGTGKAAETFTTSMEDMAKILKRTIITLSSLVKLMVTGLAGSILLVNRGILKLRLILADAGEETRILKEALVDNNKALVAMAKASNVAQAGVFTLGDEVAIAGEKIDQYGIAAFIAGEKIDKAGDKASSGKIKRSAEEIARSLDALRMANNQLNLDISLVGSSQIEQLQKKAAFEKSIIDVKLVQLEAEKSIAEVKELSIQKSLLDKKLAVDIAEIRSTSAEEILQKNQAISDAISIQGMEGLALDQARLALQVARFDSEIARITQEDAGNVAAIAALNEQKALIESLGNIQILGKAKSQYADILANTQKLEKELGKVGKTGEEIATAQLEIELERLDVAQDRAKAELEALDPALMEQVIANLEKQKKLVTEIAGKKQEGKDDKGGGVDVLGGLESSAGFISGAISEIFSASESASQNFALSLQNTNANMLAGFERLPEFAMAMVDSGADMMNGMIARAPEVIQGMIDALPMLIDKLTAAFIGLLDALPAIIGQLAEALPDIISKIFDQIPAIIAKVFEAIPQIFAALISAVPQILMNILDRLPEIISALIEGFIGSMGEIAAALIDTFILKGGAIKIAVAIVKAVVQSIGAIVTGISKGIQRALKGIFSGFEIPPLAGEKLLKNMQEGLKKVVTGLTGATEQAFGVIDIPTGGEAKKDLEKTGEAVKKAIETAGKAVAGLWNSFLDGLKKVWMFIWDKILSPIIKAFKAVWLFIWEKVLKPIVGLVQKAFAVVGEILKPLFEFLGEIFSGIVGIFSQAIAPLIEWIGSIAGIFGDAIKIYFEWIGAVTKTLMNLIGVYFKWIKAVATTLGNLVKIFFQWVGAVGKTLKNVIGIYFQWLSAVGKVLTLGIGIYFEWLKAVAKTYLNLIVIYFKWIRAVAKTFLNLIKLFGKWLSAVWETFKNIVGIFKEAFNVIVTFFKQIFKGNIAEAFRGVFEFFGKLPEMVMEAFSPIFDFFITLDQEILAAFEPIFDFFSTLEEEIMAAFKPIFDFFENLDEQFLKAIEPLLNFAKTLGPQIMKAFEPITGFFDNLGSRLLSAFQPIIGFFGTLKNIFKDAFKPITNFFNADAIGNVIKKAFSISPIGLLFKSDAIKGFIQKAINLLNPGNLLSKLFNVDSGLPSAGTIEKTIGLDLPFAKFAQGGVVPGTAPQQGDSLLNDKILALLSPGEFVVPRSIAMMPGVSDLLADLIKTGSIPQLGFGGFVKAVVSGDSEGARKEAAGAVGSDPLGGIGTSVQKALKDTENLLKDLGIPDPITFLKNEFGGAIKKMIGANKFAEGGPTGSGGPALLHPGEFVLRQSAVQSIGLSQAEFINSRGRLPQGDTQKTQNVTIVFEPGSIAMQGIQDPDRFVDELIETMKRRGIDGEFTMSSSGLRETS